LSKRRESLFLELSGKVAVVTGGAHGIGYAVAERLSQAGARVVVADRDEENGLAAAERLSADGAEAVAVRVDVTRPEEIGAMVKRALESFGSLDVLVNNAGINGRNAPLWEISDEEWEEMMAINLTSVFRCCRAVIGHMRERRSGAIVNVASISGKEGNPNQIPYSVSKAGTICLTKALAKEVIGDGIRVNAIAPALIETPLLAQHTPEDIEYLRGRIPMGRLGRAEEVATVVHFLASDDASFVTGQCYDVSGGRATY
jgi:2-dehydro-3-deoxy-L-rhamnonate dehydrogenase (NAD+)